MLNHNSLTFSGTNSGGIHITIKVFIGKLLIKIIFCRKFFCTGPHIWKSFVETETR